MSTKMPIPEIGPPANEQTGGVFLGLTKTSFATQHVSGFQLGSSVPNEARFCKLRDWNATVTAVDN